MNKPHVVCIPFPAQGHINPMLKLAQLLHSQSFHVTFVHTEFNYARLMKSQGSLESQENTVEGFRFETISDGLQDNQRGMLDFPALAQTFPTHSKQSFKELIARLNGEIDTPPVSCIIYDGVMDFILRVAEEFGIPGMVFYTHSACAMLGYLHFEELKERGYFPLKDESYFTDGYLDTKIDWIPAMEGIQLKDLPTFLRTTDENDKVFHHIVGHVNSALKTKSLILNTFEDLEQEVLDAIREKFPRLYTIGPLAMLQAEICKPRIDKFTIKSASLWKEDTQCLEWLDKNDPRSVLYVNFGSLAIMNTKQLSEFAWGLANSKYSFLWAIRPNLVTGGEEILSKTFFEEIDGRGLLLEWCPQESVLRHPSVGLFLTHCGWNSTLESIGFGVPLLCWPFFADQQINCHFACKKWGIGIEIEENVERKDVEGLVRELMNGRKGKEMSKKAMEMKMLAKKATSRGGSSYDNFHKLIDHLDGVSIMEGRSSQVTFS